jgi:hypothetical protein
MGWILKGMSGGREVCASGRRAQARSESKRIDVLR